MAPHQIYTTDVFRGHVPMAQLHYNVAHGYKGPRFVIGIDYGTTFTGVAWVLTTRGTPEPGDINVVTNWPPGKQELKVPSEISYTGHGGPQWGYNIGDNAHVIRWSKMKLEKPSKLQAIQTLRQALEPAPHVAFDPRRASRNQVQGHLTKTPEEILTDYLKQAAEVVRQDIKNKRDEEVLKRFPIDLVITHPAQWDLRARNTTFRAASKAFISVFEIDDLPPSYIRLATEPEACAQYTMSNTNIDNLRRDDCFIVLDAGGGMADLVSYKVDAVNPSFRPIMITDVSSGRYGSTNIDRYFLETFLRKRLGDQEYGKLLALGTERGGDRSGRHTMLRRGEKVMFDRFQPIKHAFMGKPKNGESQIPHPIDLPDGIGEHNDPSSGIVDGRLVITDDDLKEMFDDEVEGTLDLIRQQVTLISSKGLNVKCIFLSGGFSCNRYLYGRVCDLVRNNSCQVVRVDDPLSAVAKGAVLMGLGVHCEKPPHNTRAPCHIGIVLAERFVGYAHEEWQRYDDSLDGISRAKGHIKWVVAKGDLVTPREPIAKKVKIVLEARRRDG